MQEDPENPTNAVTEEPSEPQVDAAELADEADGSGERGRSTIAFPYVALSDAETIAQELHRFGGTATPDGIAKALSQTSKSGAFRQKVSAARIFGLITTRPGQVALTPLGNKIIDPEQQAAARVDAFLKVPLYGKLFNRYQGDLLPPVDGLERVIADWGVSAKQAPTARQVFQRSAELAGFFRRGANRLTLPDVAATTGQGNGAGVGASDAGVDDALQTLWLTLLRDGESWSAAQTKGYVDGARSIYRALAKQD